MYMQTRKEIQKRYYEKHKDELAEKQRVRRGRPDYENAEPYNVSLAQIAWLAGLYEGEGHCTFWYRKGSTETSLRISMTDEDTIRTIQRITGVGMVDCIKPQKEGYKPMWRWCVNRREQIVALIEGMWPFLHERRKEQLTPLLNHCKIKLEKRLPTYKGYINLKIEQGEL